MRAILIILDGWGVAPPSLGNAITTANTPTLNEIEASYPSFLLQASGIAVGLPWGEEGNSEVGHLNHGAGRVVLQYMPRIISAIRDGSFFSNTSLKNATFHVKTNDSALHIMGLVSSGSVHSYIDHLYALLELASREGIKKVFLHVFTDGKDSAPNEAVKFIPQLEERLKSLNLGQIATLIGRHYAMDRNANWEYTQKTYELLTEGKGKPIDNIAEYLKQSYEQNINDQHIEPAVINTPLPASPSVIKDNDAVIFFDFREDSPRQLTHAFLDENFDKFPRKKINNLYFVAMTQYYAELMPENVAFLPFDISNTLAQVLSAYGKKQLHVAETEKYAHATYFFNGLIEAAYPGEERIVITSNRGAPHEEHPEMKAEEITSTVIENWDKFDFCLINFANADMLGHTGNMQAVIAGVEAVDKCIARLLARQGDDLAIVITADHGNAEEMLDPRTGAKKTDHTSNPVPIYIIQKNKKGDFGGALFSKKITGVLADTAPTILEIMGLPAPKEMTGKSLLTDNLIN